MKEKLFPRRLPVNERVSVDFVGPYKQIQNGNKYMYIVVMHDHFTKWVEDRAICGKEAPMVANVVVQDWVLNYDTPICVHGVWSKEFMVALHQRAMIYSGLPICTV